MFNSLPKLVNKQFLIGSVLPLAMFVLAALMVFRPWGEVAKTAEVLFADKALGSVALIAAGLWLGAIGLMLLNRILHRRLSGYGFPFDLKRFVRPKRMQWCRRRREIWSDEHIKTPTDNDRRRLNKRRYEFLRAYPPTRGDVQGTEFGNIVRAYERYANRVYGIDGVVIWPRMTPSLPKDVQTQLGDGRAEMDCFTNLTWLSAVLGVAALARWSWLAIMPLHAATAPLALQSLLALGAAWAFYRMAIERALALGETVRAATDLGLPKLIAALGYEVPPTRAEQTRLLQTLRRSFQFGETITLPWAVKPASPASLAEAAKAEDEDSDD